MTTQNIHAKSNDTINTYINKCEMKMESIFVIAGEKFEGMQYEKISHNKLSYTWNYGGEGQFTIFVSWDAEGYRVDTYMGGYQEYDFREISGFYNTVRIMQLVAFKMKAGK